MNGGQLAIVGLGALLVVGVGAALMLTGGDAPGPGGLGGTGEVTTQAPTAQPPTTTAPEPLPPSSVVGSGATVATARATHYDPDNPPTPPKAQALDYVCRRHVDPATSVKHVHQETTYHFCSEGCLAKFKEDPDGLLHKRSMGE